MLQLFKKTRTDEEIFTKIFKKKHMAFEKKTCAGGFVQCKVAGNKTHISMMFKNGELRNIYV